MNAHPRASQPCVSRPLFLGGRVLPVLFFFFRRRHRSCGVASPHVLRRRGLSLPRDNSDDLRGERVAAAMLLPDSSEDAQRT